MKNVDHSAVIPAQNANAQPVFHYPAATISAGLFGLLMLFSNAASADAILGLQAFWEFNTAAPTEDSTVHDRDLILHANPNAYHGDGSLPTSEGGGVGGGSALQLPERVYDVRMGGPGTYYGDIFYGGAVFAGGDAMRADEGSGTDPFDLNSPLGYALQSWVNFDELPVNTQQALLSKTANWGFTSWSGWWLNAFRDGSGGDRICGPHRKWTDGAA